jgi:antitoxin (DNA-binding transcriptional repressor) of toxin-antitoxin stability system
MREIDVQEAATDLADLIEAAIEGEEIFIVTQDQHIMQLVPVASTAGHPQFGSAKGTVTMADDFDAPLEDFDEYM